MLLPASHTSPTQMASSPQLFVIAQADTQSYTESVYGSGTYGSDNYGTRPTSQANTGDLANTGTMVLFGLVVVSLVVFITVFNRVWRRPSTKSKHRI